MLRLQKNCVASLHSDIPVAIMMFLFLMVIITALISLLKSRQSAKLVVIISDLLIVFGIIFAVILKICQPRLIDLQKQLARVELHNCRSGIDNAPLTSRSL